jgi:hypothetical protein
VRHAYRVPITAEFWATTAQVIPTLLLTFVLAQRSGKPTHEESKQEEPKPEPLSLRSVRLAFTLAAQVSIALGVAAEFLALDGLVGGADPGAARVVVVAIGVLASWVITAAVLRMSAKFDVDDDVLARLSKARGFGVMVLISVHALFSFVIALLPVAAAIWVAIRLE